MSIWLVLAANAVQTMLIIFTVAYSSSNSWIRPAIFPLLAWLSLQILPLNRGGLPSKLLAGCVSINTVASMCQYLDVALISRWSFAAGGPTSRRGGTQNVFNASEKLASTATDTDSLWTRFKWGFFAYSAWRAPATPWQVKNVPAFDPHNPNVVPSRSRFLTHTLKKFLLCVLIIDFLSMAPQDPKRHADIFADNKVSFFGRWTAISAEDMIIRVVVTLVGWTSIYCVLQMTYCTLSIVAVATHLTGVEVWPPIMGSFSDIYSIRRFWGCFWHQTFRQRIGSPAYFLTYNIFRLRRGGLTGRYLNLFLSWIISGALHVAEEYGAGVDLGQSGSMRFFCTQAAGIVLEDAVGAVFRRFTVPRQRRWTKFVGYVWFACWMIWSSPAWLYPKLRNNKGGASDQFLPFSILGFAIARI
ncbi:unnamed protein product [Periconia digitata]|uniref:Wax synthase domain-containing protein n=1 Tax=Periconia digitata TaxID=1303443 RepID=A0A9W4XVA7_9PLEO|nr:unnamed protein product [Periconia digitata]